MKKLKPWWVTGFVDGKGAFRVEISAPSSGGAGGAPGLRVQVLPEFTVVQHRRDVPLLHALKAFFRCGVVRPDPSDRVAYRVRNREHLSGIIVPFFEEHPLQSRKRLDFLKFRRVLLLMERGEHRTPRGLEKIRKLARNLT